MSGAIAAAETPGQARVWADTKRGYLRLGLCHRCAAQAAYGHAHGFSCVEPPCASCSRLVGEFEYSAPNDWRKASRSTLRAPRMTAPQAPSHSASPDKAAVRHGSS